MTDRYFVMVSGADFDRIMGVLRLRDEVVQEVWTGTAWEPTELVMDALVGGDPLLDEVSAADAERHRPAAFGVSAVSVGGR